VFQPGAPKYMSEALLLEPTFLVSYLLMGLLTRKKTSNPELLDFYVELERIITVSNHLIKLQFAN
jgi:hypothetical protein